MKVHFSLSQLGMAGLLAITFGLGVLFQKYATVGKTEHAIVSFLSSLRHFGRAGVPPAQASAPLDSPAENTTRYRVLYTTNIPNPAESTYPNALASFLFIDPRYPTTTFLGFLWAFQDRKYTTASLLRVGDEVTMKRIPWDVAPPAVKASRRFGDSMMLSFPLYYIPEWKADRELPTLYGSGAVCALLNSLPLWQLDTSSGMGLAPSTNLYTSKLDDSGVSRLLEFHEDLAKRGIFLVVCPVPERRTIYPEMATEGAYQISRDGLPNKPILAVLEKLRAYGIPVVDTYSGFLAEKTRSPLFMHADYHWSPRAAHVAATKTFELLSEQKLVTVQNLPFAIQTQPWLYPYPTFSETPQIKALHVNLTNGPVDCDEVTGLDKVSEELMQSVVRREAVEDASVVILGDSHVLFPMREEGPPASYLAHMIALLKQPVCGICVPGDAHNGARREFLRRKLWTKARVVIMLINENTFTMRWDSMRLPSP